ncbi:MAG: YggS family pyridoxal phosphate-dependent enzyme [Candidatus Omnitrophica bacterium]|nr:YggS family pyridoxal phosphate-dependent enzyme [Candidatus Omnitrophota bacterium]
MIAENIQRLRERISAVCAEIKRDPGKITLVCVTKGRSLVEVEEAVRSGLRDIGENRVQEALLKYNDMPQAERAMLKWHMVGHLQSNKVKDAVKIFDLIHSVDSIDLTQEINKQAAKINKVQDVLLEVKTSPENTKFGFSPEVVSNARRQMFQFSNIKVRGLMTIASLGDNPQASRPYFAQLRKLRDELNPEWTLSMGMSDDFEVAIEEGADIIRIGRAIFMGTFPKVPG